jgi:phosphoenolpyruvate carboxylase
MGSTSTGSPATMAQARELASTAVPRIRDLRARPARALAASPALNNSIRLRMPYIEPLNHLQIELMKRHRAGEGDARIGDGIQLTINAIATALRNSG